MRWFCAELDLNDYFSEDDPTATTTKVTPKVVPKAPTKAPTKTPLKPRPKPGSGRHLSTAQRSEVLLALLVCSKQELRSKSSFCPEVRVQALESESLAEGQGV